MAAASVLGSLAAAPGHIPGWLTRLQEIVIYIFVHSAGINIAIP